MNYQICTTGELEIRDIGGITMGGKNNA